ncbi:DUF2000 domain-containing protein [Sphaerisporangium rubeum]|uniref:DUF2000 domain-containing protein n=1 Tax=Sphaerisporangium rubeum TaxID=321317 RepID=A0A7X0IJF7_9ACTN|nr:DUF2000 family protein [Sphaerisporangium rubeum]MBB6476063.1 hypothetical protein [Sphaerisporangium rubeum]
MRFDTKIAIVVREDLATWQKLNVTAFLSSAVATLDDLIGTPYTDATGNTYLPMLRQPVLIYTAPDTQALNHLHRRALTRAFPTAVYIEDMFKTTHDTANRETVQAFQADELPLVGLAVHGPRNPLDKILKDLSLHP